ncbi:hypothetical protein P7K49_015242 [Saguinus oedipus]|uniref:EMI domain-containing protein n=1 Tax=Saguinus oedipus TaxID=9490 RepID=A0ABQ9VAP3_SAGOE|nr:hypothetical protein P7K49_015242 [Saguinus oedipus]
MLPPCSEERDWVLASATAPGHLGVAGCAAGSPADAVCLPRGAVRAKCNRSLDGEHFSSPFLSRTIYYLGYRQVYTTEARTVLRCCGGWAQLPGEEGCLSGLGRVVNLRRESALGLVGSALSQQHKRLRGHLLSHAACQRLHKRRQQRLAELPGESAGAEWGQSTWLALPEDGSLPLARVSEGVLGPRIGVCGFMHP